MTAIAGIRFQRSGRVHYYAAADDLAVGDPVVAETERGPDLGWVVIAPRQVLVNELPEPPRASVRKARREELTPQRSAAPGEPSAAERPAHLALPLESLLCSLSAANQRYVEAKRRLPRLGQRVATPAGAGLVIAVKVLQERVTVRLDDESTVDLVGPDLTPAEPASEPESGRGGRARRGRRARRAPAQGAPPGEAS